MVRSLRGMQDPAPRGGTSAAAGVIIAVLGALAAANPESALIQALTDAVPKVASAVPAVITACGAIIAAFSPPPRFGRKA